MGHVVGVFALSVIQREGCEAYKNLESIRVMNDIKISSCDLHGSLQIPTSKSITHRVLICAAMSHDVTTIYNPNLSEDCLATLDALRKIGVKCTIEDKCVTIDARTLKDPADDINCGESASTLRFLIPLLGVLGLKARLSMSKKLFERPISVYLDVLSNAGMKFEIAENHIDVSGKLSPGKFFIPGDVSSQFVSGLLMALPLLDKESEIYLTSSLQSQPYVDITMDVMQRFGVKVDTGNNMWKVCSSNYIALPYTFEGDWSSAAVYIAAGIFAGPITLTGLRLNSKQGDRAIIDIAKQMGARVQCDESKICIAKSHLQGVQIDAKNIPDLVPIVCVLAAAAKGKTVIENISRLRLKESDRVHAMVSNLKRLGVKVQAGQNEIRIEGQDKFCGDVTLDGCNDHRIVMAMAIAALHADSEVYLTDASSVCKSYPNFWSDYRKLGGNFDVINFR